jgi:hypothetical protein
MHRDTRMSSDHGRCFLKQALMQFPEMARSVMHDSDIPRELDIAVTWMSRAQQNSCLG